MGKANYCVARVETRTKASVGKSEAGGEACRKTKARLFVKKDV